jgi:plasmid stability protein
MEEEARELLRAALFAEPRSEGSLLQILRRRFAKVGPIDLELPVRDGVRAIPDFWT